MRGVPPAFIPAAWGVKELLRQLLAAPTPHDARQRLFRFYDATPTAKSPYCSAGVGSRGLGDALALILVQVTETPNG
jgi:hypothetical protein